MHLKYKREIPNSSLIQYPPVKVESTPMSRPFKPKFYDVFPFSPKLGLVKCCGMVSTETNFQTHLRNCQAAKPYYEKMGKAGRGRLGVTKFMGPHENPSKPFCENYTDWRFHGHHAQGCVPLIKKLKLHEGLSLMETILLTLDSNFSMNKLEMKQLFF